VLELPMQFARSSVSDGVGHLLHLKLATKEQEHGMQDAAPVQMRGEGVSGLGMQ